MLRPYQQSAFDGVVAHWEQGVRRVLLVAPTGAGKTVLATAFCERELLTGSVLFVVHRRELVTQTAERFRGVFGHQNVGVVLPGADRSPFSKIQVGTVQTLLARGIRPDVSLVIFDEAHHYAATDWVGLLNHYSGARLLGLTATPERQDGKPLGDLFDELVVAAKYSELLRDGFLVPCKVCKPPSVMGADLALDPLVAYQKYGEGQQGFIFCASVEAAEELAKRFTEADIPARCIEAKTKKGAREQYLEEFKRGDVRIITNVNTMTEGVDVPQAAMVMLAKAYRHVGGFLQAAGRGLRTYPGKTYMILIDLVGAVMQPEFGYPTDDRVYSLDNDGIKRDPGQGPISICVNCGHPYASRPGGCPECGYVAPAEEKDQPRIYDMELEVVFAGPATPDDAKEREYRRLRDLGRARGWSLYFVQKEYRKLFGVMPVIHDATEEEQREEYDRLRMESETRGYKAGYVGVRFKEMFGKWPPRKWAA